ncbi:MAG: ATP-binding protein [Proteobacteria bacterium]|nr:ATP-binding protein [Pseudomonadota bacterium]
MSETRRFSVHPEIIYSLIVAQAGSLGKAVLECVMNSIDAHATRVDITVDANTIRIQDDGKGFRTRAEIEQWFEVFGFPHAEGDRDYGKFGIGRGQLWSFCSTVWRTETFEMDVDIKRRGIDYRLKEGLPRVKGVDIEGKFYDRQLTSALAAFERELTDLALYAQIPVTLNGKRINKVAAQEKWDHETADAWIKTSDIGQLAVYNLGVLVRRYPGYQFGCGGTVVTKPGVRLAVNMARNDVLVAECEVWKRIRKVLQAKSDDRIKSKRTRMTEVELQNVARRFVAGEMDYGDIKAVKLVTDIVGRGHTIDSLATGPRQQAPLTTADAGSQMGERAHTNRLAFVVSPLTLERFGVETVREFQGALVNALAQSKGTTWLSNCMSRLRVIEDLGDAVPTLREGYDVLKDEELSKPELAALTALRLMADDVSRAMKGQEILDRKSPYRNIWLGASDVAEAWTDGRSKVIVERRQIQLMNQGIGGFVGLANLLVHEFLHDTSDVGSHIHDQEFYSRYHDATCSHSGVLNQAVFRGLRKWVLELHSRKLRVPKEVVTHLDQVEKLIREAESSRG